MGGVEFNCPHIRGRNMSDHLIGAYGLASLH